MKKPLSFLLFLVFAASAAAQDGAPSWLESTLYGNGKINAVIVVIAIIVTGIGLWMWSMDRRIKRMEERQK
jgi:type IV secretory pathway VirB2 component (pilin)